MVSSSIQEPPHLTNSQPFRENAVALIREAVQIHLEVWGPTQGGFDTYVRPGKLRSTSPGYCDLPKCYYNEARKIVARPRKLKTPTTSVTVVRMIEDDWAGS